MASAAWTGPGQMSVRFEIARQIGGGAAGLFKPPAPPAAVAAVGMGGAAAPAMMTSGMASDASPAAVAPPAPAVPIPPLPKLQTAAYYGAVGPALGGQTKTALTQASSPQEWNALFLSSPEFMHR